MNNNNTTFGFFLIFLVVFGFAYFNRLNKEDTVVQGYERDSINSNSIVKSSLLLDKRNNDQLHNLYGNFAISIQGKDQLVSMQNDLMEIKLRTKGGSIESVRLKKYTNYNHEPLYLFNSGESVFKFIFITINNRVLNSSDFFYEKIANSNIQTILRLNVKKDKWLDLIYTLHSDDYMVDLKLLPHHLYSELSPFMNNLDIQWGQKIRQQEKGRKFEDRYARLTYKFLSNEVEQLRDTRNDFKNIFNKLKWIGYKDQYFSSVLIAKNYFESTTLNSKYIPNGKYIKEYNVSTSLPYNVLSDSNSVNLHFYFGPNDFFLLKNYDKTKLKGQNLELEKLVPLGWSLFRLVNKCIVIPVFSWLTNKGICLGLAIFLLTLIIKMLLFPLTYQSFLSSAKIRLLKPQIEAIATKYSGKDKALMRQQKTMIFYRQVGVNPMSGCLPILLQIPFSIALFLFFPSAIELRHQHFLWSNDLSSYDSLIHWEGNIPFISNFLGNHISLFCLLMTLITIFNSKFTTDQQSTGQDQMQGMKLMTYFMPCMMFFFLNSYPAGLNYYYLISTAITIIQTISFRLFLNEEKLLAKLEANKKKSKIVNKKSGFMARLGVIQRKQRALLRKRLK